MSVLRLFLESIPACLQESLIPLNGLLLTMIFGNTSTKVLSGFSSSSLYLNPFNFIFSFLLNGVTSGVSFSLGQNRMDIVCARIRLAFITAISCGIFFGIPLCLLAGVLLPDDLSFARGYLRVQALSLPLVVLIVTLCGVCRGLQHIEWSLSIQVCLVVSSTVGNLIIVHLYGQRAPGLVMTLSAFVTALANLLSVLLGLFFLWRCGVLRQLSLFKGQDSEFKFSSFFKESIYLFIRSVLIQLCFFIAGNIVVHTLGGINPAGYQILVQLWMMSSYITDGVAVMVNIKGSRYRGEGNDSLLKLLFSNSLVLALLFGTVFMFSYFFFQDDLLRLFTSDEVLINFLKNMNSYNVVLLFQPINSLVFVFDGILFATQSFSFIAKTMVLSVGFLFFPFLAPVFFAFPPSLSYLYFCLGLVNVGRCIGGTIKIIQVVKAKDDHRLLKNVD
ncbi:hypothetical protein GEMRC1_013495 [Eukaryota sp. GEM-RC1]